VLQVYAVLTVLAIIVLSLLAGDVEHGLAHALAAVSTGGFSSHGDSLASTSTAFALAVLGFALLGAVTLPLYYQVFREKASQLWVDVEWAWLLGAVAIGAMLLMATLLLQQDLSVATAVKQGLLLSMSAQSTAGFAAMAPAELNDFGLGVLMTQMLIGGNVGSTAGGVKLLHILLLARVIQVAIQRAGMGPHAVVTPRLFGEPIEPQTIVNALLVVILFMLTVLVSWLIFLAHGMPPMASLFEVVSATGTVGLSAGLVSTDLPTTLKLVLCFDMLAGRVEVVALLVLLWPGTWIGRRYAS
jgi:trk system potassium uptake protein TrkH